MPVAFEDRRGREMKPLPPEGVVPMTARLNTAIVLAFTLLTLPVAGIPQEHQAYTDQQIQTMIEHDLARKQIQGVKVEASGGVVTLRGTVASLWAKEQASEVATNIHDVKDVVSTLTVAPAAGGDEELAASIRSKVLRHVFYTMFDEIGLSVKNGVVSLSGRVTLPYKAQEIAKLASKETGVQAVDNQIRVLPFSTYDEQLRAELARRIYEEFPDYAVQSSPPIHIIVENGHVTLIGVVRNEVERRLAMNAARSTFGVTSVEDKLTVRTS
jgi:osmotically-inducible protein OsmY